MTKPVDISISGTGVDSANLAGIVTVTVLNQGTSVGTFNCPVTGVNGNVFTWAGTTTVSVNVNVNSLLLQANAVDGNSNPFTPDTSVINF